MIYLEILISNSIMAVLMFFGFYLVHKKDFTFKEYSKVTIGVFTAYYLFYFGAVFSWLQATPSTHLWFPYQFGGYPAYGAGVVGVRWWNHIDVLVNGILKITMNPIGLSLFILSLFWFFKTWSFKRYTLIILTELFLIISTRWN